jgi:hypothetical protein
VQTVYGTVILPNGPLNAPSKPNELLDDIVVAIAVTLDLVGNQATAIIVEIKHMLVAANAIKALLKTTSQIAVAIRLQLKTRGFNNTLELDMRKLN